MTLKTFLALTLCVLASISFVSCQKSSETEDQETSVTTTSTTANNEDLSAGIPDTLPQTAYPSEKSDANSMSEVTVSSDSSDPSAWSKSQIIEFYKRAAARSDATATSEQSIILRELSISDGAYERFFKIITPVMTKLLANHSVSEDGITGGFSRLRETDAKTAKAYTVSDKTAVEFTLHDQISGAKDDPLEGSVGHAVTTVGDISAVSDEMKALGLPLEIPEDNAEINYSNAAVKVLVDSSGNIVNGTWSYRVVINLNDYSAFNRHINSTTVVMDNTITVNGGFST